LVKPSVCFSILEGNIADMFEALTSSKVNPHDEISTVVCLKCLLNLKLAYNFQQQIKKCEEKLAKHLNVREEPASPNLEEGVKTDKEEFKDLVNLCEKNCAICGLCFDAGSINDHIRQHFKSAQKCGVCDKSFADVESCREHLSEHPEKAVYECGNCRAKFRYKSFYDMHRETVCVKKRIATLGLQSKQAINLLLESQTREKKMRALGAITDRAARKEAFKLGLRSSEAIQILLGAEESPICTICFKKFASKKSFQTHTHKTKTCQFCQREITIYAYKKHVQDHTLGPQICHLCGAILQSRSTLLTHIFYSHNNNRYKCEDCGKLFKKKTAKDLHRRREHLGQPTHYCDTCGKGFFSGKFLDKHIKMKHLKLRPHICDFCKRGFSSPYALKTHTRQHTNETPYRCEVCGDGFRQNVSLKAHRKSKHNIVEAETCSCKVCGKGFASEVALYAHMRRH
jgi:KRAB domain-containing zinc finger protein